ncbi:hypothetical protein VUJ46_01555 [Chryseobacterium sp. MYb264]|uniref:hypothetical protein n=1 Tax=Chryseobacterium sp. MYb264 TaxID=2745153 RepID=UPI002E0DD09E|nr:hypothetical protein VUJ46_01555 [Chryseobacterium sp. MYb264]
MKKILSLLFIITNIFLWGQGVLGKYVIESHVKIKPNNGSYGDGCQNMVAIDVVFNNTTKRILDEDLNNIPSNSYSDYGVRYDHVDANASPVKMRSTASRQWRRLIGGCGGNGSFTNSVREKSITYCSNSYVNNDAVNWWNHDISIKIYPKLTIQNDTNTFLPDVDKITINSHTGFRPQEYNWQYSFDSVNWIDLPQFNGQSSLTINATDINVQNHIGENIYFRQQYATCDTNAVSNIVFYTILKSSPHISSSSITPTKCFDTTDGTATLNFDRTLISGETLKLSLVNTVTGAAVLNQDITAELQAGTSYTLQNLPPGTYKLDLLGTYNGNATYTDGTNQTIDFEITKPTPVSFSLVSQTNVYCFEGSDGVISLTAGGGQNQYQYYSTKNGQLFLDWTNFNNGNNAQLQNLGAGTYKIKVRDSNLCIAKDNGNEKEITVIITQPSQAIAIPTAEVEVSQPTGYGLSNGYISVRVIGGTPNTDGSYNFEWRKDSSAGTVINTGITTDAINNPFTIKVDGLPAGNYYLTVKDKNYANASSQLGNCGIISKEFIVSQPDPLAVNIQVEKQISCNIANNYQFKPDLNNNGVPDEAEDGMLKATATGGVGAYSYQWQKLNGGLFQNLPGAIQSTLGDLTTGTYKVLIKDANNNTAETQYVFVFPAELAITLFANTIACYSQSSGQVSVAASGGTGGYTYQWNTNDTTPTVTGLSAGNYFVLVNDTKNCKVSGSISIQGPDQLIIDDISVQNPICFGAGNGEIKVNISGGKAPYIIHWSNGVTGENNTNIPAGMYTVTVTDANGCSIFRNYTLTDPAELTVDLGPDRTLCLGDTQVYDVTISDPGATYQWKDSTGNIISTSPSVTISAAGTYTVLITDSKGCTATDSVVIKNSSEVLNPQFMLTTHAYREATVVLVNTSPKAPETVEWIIPDTPDIQVLNKTNEFLELKFSQLGAYEIGLKGTQGACEKTFYKKVIVEENTSGVVLNPAKASNIREFTILPNPNNGVFQVLVGLDKASIINVRIIDMISHEAYPPVKMTPSTYFTIPYNTSLPAGSYLIILETGSESLVKKMLVK